MNSVLRQKYAIQAVLATFTFAGESIPDYMHDGIAAYILDGRPCAHFLHAVITGNLFEAAARADDTNSRLLHVYAAFFRNHAPASCYGGPKAYDRWLEMHRMERGE